jgi:hypothetical protein
MPLRRCCCCCLRIGWVPVPVVDMIQTYESIVSLLNNTNSLASTIGCSLLVCKEYTSFKLQLQCSNHKDTGNLGPGPSGRRLGTTVVL